MKPIFSHKIQLILCVFLLLILAVSSCNNNADDDADDDTGGPADGNEPGNPVILMPLAQGAVPYLEGNGLPVPTHRYVDQSRVAGLNGPWLFAADEEDVGESELWFSSNFDRSDWQQIEVPGSWNAAFPELLEYKGAGWYALIFDTPEEISSEELNLIFIRFGAVFLNSKIYLNGELIGTHMGGYTPIFVPFGDHLSRRKNTLVVRADNRLTWESIPANTIFHPNSHGWWPYGGIIRDVSIHRLFDPWIFKLEPRFVSDLGDVEVTVGIFARTMDEDRLLDYEIIGPGLETIAGTVHLEIDRTGVLIYRFTISTSTVNAWSRQTPENIYEMTLEDPKDKDGLTVRFGYRTFEADGGELWLNGQRDFWHGINRHSCYPDSGPVESDRTISREVEKLLELHVNHVRPGHYPVDERLLDALTDAGITVMEELPVYQIQFGQMKDEAILANAGYQLAEFIERDKNNPAILAWSVGNEYGNFWPSSRILTREMNEQAKRFDPYRPTIAVIANVTCVVPLDFTLGFVDIIGINQYYGWYIGNVGQATACLDKVHGLYPNKPIVATEFGAGAVAGWYLLEGQQPGPEPIDDHSYTEDFQNWFLKQQLDQLLALDYLSGVMPWVFADFRMEWDPSTGDPHPVSGMNLKGLQTHDRQTKKMSFDTVAQRYEGLED